MNAPDTGIHGITLQHVKNLSKNLDSNNFAVIQALYDMKLDGRLITAILHYLEKDEHLPSKEKVLEYQAQFDKEKETMESLNDIFNKIDEEKGG